MPDALYVNGPRLRTYRLRAALSVADLARIAGVSPRTIAAFEQGDRSSHRPDRRRYAQAPTVHALAKALKVVPADILDHSSFAGREEKREGETSRKGIGYKIGENSFSVDNASTEDRDKINSLAESCDRYSLAQQVVALERSNRELVALLDRVDSQPGRQPFVSSEPMEPENAAPAGVESDRPSDMVSDGGVRTESEQGGVGGFEVAEAWEDVKPV